MMIYNCTGAARRTYGTSREASVCAHLGHSLLDTAQIPRPQPPRGAFQHQNLAALLLKAARNKRATTLRAPGRRHSRFHRGPRLIVVRVFGPPRNCRDGLVALYLQHIPELLHFVRRRGNRNVRTVLLGFQEIDELSLTWSVEEPEKLHVHAVPIRCP